jgi:hypothetical protein
MTNTAQMKTGGTVKVNGLQFTVERIAGRTGELLVTLIGRRGAERALVQNIHSGRFFLTSSSKSEPVTSFEVLS